MMNRTAFSFKRLAACAAFALCIAAGSASTAAADHLPTHGVVGGSTPAFSLPSWYPGHPTSTSIGGDPTFYKLTAACSAWQVWDSRRRSYFKTCPFSKFERMYVNLSPWDYHLGYGVAFYHWQNGTTSCAGSWERPRYLRLWTHWTSGFCPRF
jgi:hypothetical protein